MAVAESAENGRVAIADVETSFLAHGEIPRTKFWGLYVEGEDYRRFETTMDLWRYLETRRDKLIIYHHHDFDIVQALVDNAPIAVKDVRSGRVLRSLGPGLHEWRNSYALFPAGLKTILKECGFAKPGLDDLVARNIADTVDTCKAFRMLSDAYRRVWGIYPLARQYLTASGVAFAAAQRVAGKLPIDLTRRDAYRGGRVEAFRVGNCGVADAYDINSSYPASFLDIPTRDALVHCRVQVDTDGPSPFWHAHEESEKLIFPSGKFETWIWASNYEKYIRPHGRVKKLEFIEPPYPVDLGWLKGVSSLISEVYEERGRAKARGDSVSAYSCKLGLNSIYGRLGLKPEREIAIIKDTVAGDDDVSYFKLPDGRFLSFVKIKSHPAANYPYAGIITDNARARLYDALEKSGEPFYCDTDSVFVRKGAEFEMPRGSALGEWKPEGAANFTVTGAKDYVFGPENAVETRTDNDGVKHWVDAAGADIRPMAGHEKFALKGGKGHFEWTLKRALGGGKVAQRTKHRISEYDKREILPGGSTLPLRVSSW